MSCTKDDIMKNAGNQTTAVSIQFYCMDTQSMQSEWVQPLFG